MDNATINILISTGGSVLVGVFGMFFTANQLGKRIDDLRMDTNLRMGELRSDLKELRTDLKELRTEFNTFKDMVNGKFAALDSEIGKLMDRKN